MGTALVSTQNLYCVLKDYNVPRRRVFGVTPLLGRPQSQGATTKRSTLEAVSWDVFGGIKGDDTCSKQKEQELTLEELMRMTRPPQRPSTWPACTTSHPDEEINVESLAAELGLDAESPERSAARKRRRGPRSTAWGSRKLDLGSSTLPLPAEGSTRGTTPESPSGTSSNSSRQRPSGSRQGGAAGSGRRGATLPAGTGAGGGSCRDEDVTGAAGRASADNVGGNASSRGRQIRRSGTCPCPVDALVSQRGSANARKGGENPFMEYEDREQRLQMERHWLQQDADYMESRLHDLRHHTVQAKLAARSVGLVQALTGSTSLPVLTSKAARPTAHQQVAQLPNQHMASPKRTDRNQPSSCIRSLKGLQKELQESQKPLEPPQENASTNPPRPVSRPANKGLIDQRAILAAMAASL